MRKRITILVISGTMAGLVSLLYLTDNLTADKSTLAVYENCMNKYIRIYRLKAYLYKDSDLEHIRQSAKLAMKKAAFLWINRDRLIKEMAAQKVGKKQVHIQAYLNERFQESRLKENHLAYRLPSINL